MAEEIKKEITEEATETEETSGHKKMDIGELAKKLNANSEEVIKKRETAAKVIAEGKGVLELETPIKAGDEEIKSLPYDFTELTGLDYTEAMDSDMNSQQIFRITSRQALSLFAVAASKQVPQLDRQDIVERIGMTDSVIATQLATLFFSASTRAGQFRLSRR